MPISFHLVVRIPGGLGFRRAADGAGLAGARETFVSQSCKSSQQRGRFPEYRSVSRGSQLKERFLFHYLLGTCKGHLLLKNTPPRSRLWLALFKPRSWWSLMGNTTEAQFCYLASSWPLNGLNFLLEVAEAKADCRNRLRTQRSELRSVEGRPTPTHCGGWMNTHPSS